MGDFFAPPPNTDLPPPPPFEGMDVPPANFRLIGQQLGAGLKDAGAVGSSTPSIGAFLTQGLDALLSLIAQVLAIVLSKLLCIIAFLMQLVTSIDDAASPGFAAVINSSLAHVFQIPLPGTTARKVAASTSGEQVGAQIGKSILGALTSGVHQSVGQPLQPNDTAAGAFIGKLAQIGVEGWVDGFVSEAIGGERLASVLELVPIMNDVLGLGRLSRRALAPIMKILIADPYTWKLNNDYRPTLLAHDQAVRQFLRGHMTRPELDTQLGRQGYSSTFIDALININSKFVGASDLDFALSHEIITREQAVQELRDQGWDAARANQILDMLEQHRFDAWSQKYASDSIAAFVAGEIDEAALGSQLSLSQMPKREQDFARVVALNRRALNVKHLTLGEVQTMIQAHVMNIDDLRTWMTRENYPPDEQTLLELWLLGKITTADEAAAAKAQKATDAATAKAAKLAAQQQKAVDAAAKLQSKGVSLAQFEQLVTDGLRSFDEYTAFLKQQGFSTAAIADLTDLLHKKLDDKAAAAIAAQAVRDAAAVKHIPLSTIEAGVKAGTLAIADLQRFMQSNGFTDPDIKIVVDQAQAQLDAAAAQAKAKAEAAAQALIQNISLPELERAARLGLTTPAAYGQALDDAGFDPQSRDLMVGILNAQIASDQAALDTRANAAAAAKKKQISLPQLEQAVIAGVRPIGDYQATLSTLGFDATDQQTLVALLQLQVDNAKAVAEKQAAAAAKSATRNVSIGDLARAVKLGVLSIDAYRSELTADGFGPDDVALLSTSLLAEVAITQQAATKRNAAANTLAKKGLSLAQQEQLVRQGIASLDAYTAFLLQQGYSQADAQSLTALLQLQVQQDQVAADKHAIADQRAATKSISLAKEEQAVIDGIRTMDDYAALLVSLGFDETDQATLIDLLSQKVGAALSKAAAAAAAAPAATVPPGG